MFLRTALGLSLFSALCYSATFGSVVPVIGGASDVVIDEGRSRVYLVNTVQNRIEVYSVQQKRLLTPVKTDGNPLAAAISRSGQVLYVASKDASALDIIDLDSQQIVNRVTLPAQPQGVAVGADERVLISTIGSGAGNLSNVLLIYDPSAQGPSALAPVPVTPAPPLAPNLPAPTGKQFQDARSRLQASPDASIIIGVNIPAATLRIVFVYEVASGTVLRSRLVTNSSGVLAVAPDNSRFMSGSTLFDTATLQVLAQENLANAPYEIPTGTNFNTETNQGGSVFSPDGSALYAAFDIAPQTNPPSRANISQMMLNDPDNLLINTALQLPENLAGKMAISSDGANIYALSESGFIAIPIGTMSQQPLAVPDSTVVLLNNDQCGALASQRTARVSVNNAGKGRLTATAQVLTTTATNTPGLGGVIGIGPGGGIAGGGGVFIILPPTIPTGGPPAVSVGQTAPAVQAQQTGSGATLNFTFNPSAARALGTISPSHDFVVQSNEAINIPSRVRVYQNNRNSEATGDIVPVPVAISANEALEDLVYDATRQRLYLANSGMNRVEVFDIRQKAFLAPVKVGQLPRSIAMTPDGGTLYVANSGGENISVVDLDKLQAIGRIKFPLTPLLLNQALATPTMIAAGQRGPLFMMSTANANGTSANAIWQIVGDQALPRGPSQVIGSVNGLPRALAGPISMAATPAGENIIVSAADGSVYLYDALADDFVQSRQYTSLAASTGMGYYGTAAAGPRGQYYVVNGITLNQALAPINGAITGSTRPIAATYAVSAATYARFTQPARANTTALPSDPGQVEIVDAATGQARAAVPALEGPISQATTTGRATAIDPHLMAIDSAGTTAYLLTTSGLSIIPLNTSPASARPSVNTRGTVNLGDYQTTVAQNSLVAIFGTNLAASDQATSAPLPVLLGGTCVTLNNNPLPLFATTPGQINAQIPPELAVGNYSLVVHSVNNKAASSQQTIAVAKYAPSVFIDPSTKQPAVLHADGRFVTKDHPGKRDEPLVMYAEGLGLPTSGKVTSGNLSPTSPLATVGNIQVFFGDPAIKQAGIIVDFAGLAPGLIGVYQLNLRIPGDHIKGDAVPITIKVGGVSSPTTGVLAPTITVE
ncbi:MAG: beta-propeller fold lactonase family protein [Bryobacteraceae bacterium]